MKRVVKLTEQDLYRIVKRVIKEQAATAPQTQAAGKTPTGPKVNLEVLNSLPDAIKNWAKGAIVSKTPDDPNALNGRYYGVGLELEKLKGTGIQLTPESDVRVVGLNPSSKAGMVEGPVNLSVALKDLTSTDTKRSSSFNGNEIAGKLSRLSQKPRIKVGSTDFYLVPNDSGRLNLYYGDQQITQYLKSLQSGQ